MQADDLLIPATDAEVEAELCLRSLRYFGEAAWPLIEPGTPFSPNWHIDVICEHLEACARREIRRLIINIPPRCMKSSLVAVMWPTWEWLRRPETKWMFVSYGAQLSIRDSLKCRRLIQSAGVTGGSGRELTVLEQIGYQGLLREIWGDDVWGLAEDQSAKVKFENTQHGYRLATSIGGVATGEGADIICIDDPHKADEIESDTVRQGVLDWHDGTIPTRFNQPKSGVEVLIMQRLHEEDLTGHLLDQGDWEHLCLPMEYEPQHQFVWPNDPRGVELELLWPDRVGDDEVGKIKTTLGSYRAAGQLQQRPAPAEGLLFKRKHFRRWRFHVTEREMGHVPLRTYLLDLDDGETKHVDAGTVSVLQTCDVAASDKQTADWTVVSTWGVTPLRFQGLRVVLLLDCERQRFDVLEVAGFMKRKNDEWQRPPLWVEQFGAGNAPLKVLRRDGYPAIPLKPEQGTQTQKIGRAWPAVAAYEAHTIFHPVETDENRWWLAPFEHELLSFPAGKNDDMVDTVSYAARVVPAAGVEEIEGRETPAAEPPASAGIRGEQF